MQDTVESWTSHSCEISPFTRTPDTHSDWVAFCACCF